MKLLVFSDSHRRTSDMISAIEAQQPDTIIHLGDLLSDTREIRLIYPTIPLVAVPGNCDGWTEEPDIKLIAVQDKKILLSHGHRWNVKQGYEVAQLSARRSGADILLFGHTHVAHCQREEDGLWVVNPGPSPRSYAVISIENGEIACQIIL